MTRTTLPIAPKYRAEYQRLYRAANPEKMKAIRERYYQKTKHLRAAQERAWREKNPEKSRAITKRWRAKNNYKPQVRRSLLQEQVAGRPRPTECEVCGRGGRLCFDHCHSSGVFRGWLCSRCNTALGFAGDSPDILRSLAVYLEQARG